MNDEESVMPALPGPSVRRRQLGNALRKFREGAHLTAEDAARVLDCHASKLSRIENGQSGVRARDVRDLLDRYGVDDAAARTALEALARSSYQRGWWHDYSDALDPGYTDLIALEATASDVRNYQTLLVPGLLQTESYLRAVIDAHPNGYAEEQVRQRLDVRAARQQALTRESSPLRLWTVVHEAALRHAIGGARTMREQLAHLREFARVPNVTLQVLPFEVGAHPGLNGPFALIGFPELRDLDVVYLETLTSSLYVEAPEQVRQYADVFEHLRAVAASPKRSLAFIDRLRDDL
ncbi:helix-turn-helix domain-containing protein [Streptodolium elevatio]|uniref:Helix-turn-helix transcriptional regulator n=1 Tax=Streptodolium elevatio TaxID=3157996 RepID=A0ABV3DH18_9ACTN